MREGYKAAFDCADLLMKNSDFTFTHLNKEEFNESLLFFTKNKNRLSFVDTTLLILSKSLGVPVATFDKDLQKALSS
jgi:predicted nucleic acid-binding protein